MNYLSRCITSACGRMMTCFALLIAPYAVGSSPRQNIVFIAVDDLGNVLSSSRGPAHTPSLDRLAGTGVRFDHAYCQIPLCNPSRASVLTGRRPDETCVYDLARNFRACLPDVVTLPQFFRRHGWITARVGKIYHYDVPNEIGTNGMDDPASWDQVMNPKGRDVADQTLITNPTPAKPLSAALSWLAADGPDEEQTDGMIATAATRFIQENRDRPFFLGVGFFRPHTPFVAPKRYFESHPLNDIRLPSSSTQARENLPSASFAHNNTTPHYGLDEFTCRRALQAYCASVSFVDAQIGRIITAVEQSGLADQTIIVVWSDNGYHLGEHGGIWQKRTLFEESTRVPLLIKSPGMKSNGQPCRAVVELLDIYPTLVELAGLAPPEGLRGHSLVPLLRDPGSDWPYPAFSQIVRPTPGGPIMGRSIRTAKWRYTEWADQTMGVELYDELSDPSESNNLSASPAHAATVAALRESLERTVRPYVPAELVEVSRL